MDKTSLVTLNRRVQALADNILPQRIRLLSNYKVQPHNGLIKLDAMESPYSWDNSLERAWLASLADCAVNRYPDAECRQIKQKFRELLQLSQDYDLLFGNGSDELIQLLLLSLYRPGETLVDLSPGFVMYRHIAKTIGYDYLSVDLNGDFTINLEQTKQAIDQYQPKLIFIARPNNPTANAFDKMVVEAIIQSSNGLVIIDEAYSGFCQDDCLDFICHYPQVLIMRTMSKMGLAGLRFGFLIGHKTWINQFNKVRLPYNINSLTQRSMAFALEHNDIIQQQSAKICQDRDALYQELAQIADFTVFPSQTNFITLRSHKVTANVLSAHLLADGILIKNLDGAHPLTSQCLRISIGTEAENRQLLSSLKQALFHG